MRIHRQCVGDDDGSMGLYHSPDSWRYVSWWCKGRIWQICYMSCVFSCSNRMALWLKKKHAREPMRTLLLVPCAQGGVMHSLGRSLGRAEEPNIIFEDGPWGVLQTSSAYSVCRFRGKIVLLDISFQYNVVCTLLKILYM